MEISFLINFFLKSREENTLITESTLVKKEREWIRCTLYISWTFTFEPTCKNIEERTKVVQTIKCTCTVFIDNFLKVGDKSLT